MADNLKMNGLSLNDNQNGPSHPAGRSAYIPPHLRNQSRGGPPRGPPAMGYDGTGPPPGPGGPPGAWGPAYVHPSFLTNAFCPKSNLLLTLDVFIEMPVRDLVRMIGQTLPTSPLVVVLP